MGVENGHTYTKEAVFAVAVGPKFDRKTSRLLLRLNGAVISSDKEHTVSTPGLHELEVGFLYFQTLEPSAPQSLAQRIHFVVESSERSGMEWGLPLSLPPTLSDVPISNIPWDDVLLHVISPSLMPQVTVRTSTKGRPRAFGNLPFTVQMISRQSGFAIRHTVEAYASLRCLNCDKSSTSSTLLAKLPFLMIRGHGVGVVSFSDDSLDEKEQLSEYIIRQYVLTVHVGYSSSNPHYIDFSVSPQEYQIVPSIISKDLIYEAGSALYMPRGSIVLQSGSLTIKGPSVVMMGAGAKLVCSGKISIDGSVNNKSVVFITTTTKTSFWSGIRAQGAAAELTIKGAMILRGGGMIDDPPPRAILHLTPGSTTYIQNSVFAAASKGSLLVAASDSSLKIDGMVSHGFLSALRLHKCNIEINSGVFIGFVLNTANDDVAQAKEELQNKAAEDAENNATRTSNPIPINLPKKAPLPEFVTLPFTERNLLSLQDGFSGGDWDNHLGWKSTGASIEQLQWHAWMKGNQGRLRSNLQDGVTEAFNNERLFRKRQGIKRINVHDTMISKKGPRVIAGVGESRKKTKMNKRKARFSEYLQEHLEENIIHINSGNTKISNTLIFGSVGDCLDLEGKGGTVTITQSWFEGCSHEGIAVSVREPEEYSMYIPEVRRNSQKQENLPNNLKKKILKKVVVDNTVLAGCQQGVEVGSSRSDEVLVDMEHILLLQNGIGLRLGDNYQSNQGYMMATGLLRCRRCAFIRNNKDVWHAQKIEGSKFLSGTEISPAAKIWVHDSLVESMDAAILDPSNVFPRYRPKDSLAVKIAMMHKTERILRAEQGNTGEGDIASDEINEEKENFMRILDESVLSNLTGSSVAGIVPIVDTQTNISLSLTGTLASAVTAAAAAQLNAFFALLPTSSCGHGIYGLSASTSPFSKEEIDSFVKFPYGLHKIYKRLGYVDPELTSKVLESVRVPEINLNSASIIMPKKTATLNFRSDEPARFSLLRFCQEQNCSSEEYKQILGALDNLEKKTKHESKQNQPGLTCKVGDDVIAEFEGDGKMYKAKIEHITIDENILENSIITIQWDDGDPSHRNLPFTKVFKDGGVCNFPKDKQNGVGEDKTANAEDIWKHSARDVDFWMNQFNKIVEKKPRWKRLNMDHNNVSVCANGGRTSYLRLKPSNAIIGSLINGFQRDQNMNNFSYFDIAWGSHKYDDKSEEKWENIFIDKWKAIHENKDSEEDKRCDESGECQSENVDTKASEHVGNILDGREHLFVVVLWANVKPRVRGDTLHFLCEERLSQMRVVNIYQFSPNAPLFSRKDTHEERWFDKEWYNEFWAIGKDSKRIYDISAKLGTGPFQVILLRGTTVAFERAKTTINMWIQDDKEKDANIEILGRVDDIQVAYFAPKTSGLVDDSWYRPPPGKPTDDLQILLGISPQATQMFFGNSKYFLNRHTKSKDNLKKGKPVFGDWLASQWFGDYSSSSQNKVNYGDRSQSFDPSKVEDFNEMVNGVHTLHSDLSRGVSHDFFRNDGKNRLSGTLRSTLHQRRKEKYSTPSKSSQSNLIEEMNSTLSHAKILALANRPMSPESQFHFGKTAECPKSTDVYWNFQMGLGALPSNTFEVLASVVGAFALNKTFETSDNQDICNKDGDDTHTNFTDGLGVLLNSCEAIKKIIEFPSLNNARENIYRAALVARHRPRLLEILLRPDLSIDSSSLQWIKFVVPAYRIGSLQISNSDASTGLWADELANTSIANVADIIRRIRTFVRRRKWNKWFQGYKVNLQSYGMGITIDEIKYELIAQGLLITDNVNGEEESDDDTKCALSFAINLWHDMCKHWKTLKSHGFSPISDLPTLRSSTNPLIKAAVSFFSNISATNVGIGVSNDWYSDIEMMDGGAHALALYLFSIDHFPAVRDSIRSQISNHIREAKEAHLKYSSKRKLSMKKFIHESKKRETEENQNKHNIPIIHPTTFLANNMEAGWGGIHTTEEDVLLLRMKLTRFYAQWAPGKLTKQSSSNYHDMKDKNMYDPENNIWNKNLPMEALSWKWLGRERTLWFALLYKYQEAAWQISRGNIKAPDAIAASAAVEVVEKLEMEAMAYNASGLLDEPLDIFFDENDSVNDQSIPQTKHNETKKEELRIDTNDNKPYTMNSFFEHYGSLDEWNAARSLTAEEEKHIDEISKIKTSLLEKDIHTKMNTSKGESNDRKPKQKKFAKKRKRKGKPLKLKTKLKLSSKMKGMQNKIKNFNHQHKNKTLQEMLAQQSHGQRQIGPMAPQFRSAVEVNTERSSNEIRRFKWDLPPFLHFRLFVGYSSK